MEPLQFTIMTKPTRDGLAFSALPDAPVVPERTPRWARSRIVTAGVLRRLADVLSPAAPTASHRLAAGRGNGLIRWDESPCRPSPTASA